MADYSEMAAAEAGAETPAGGEPKPKAQLVCPVCNAKFEEVEKEGEAMPEGESETWEKDLRTMAARTPETEGEPQ